MKKFFLLFPLLLLPGCGRNKIPVYEIVSVVKKHSCAATDSLALYGALTTDGISSLQAIDRRAAIINPQKIAMTAAAAKPVPADQGCGLLVFRKHGKVVAARVFKGSSAFLAGLEEGDTLLMLDGREASALSDAGLNSLLFGSAAGRFAVRFKKAGGAVYAAQLVRSSGLYPNVWCFMIPGSNTGYVRIMSFSMKAAEFLEKRLDALVRVGATELILDVRHNSDGSLEELHNALRLFAARPGVLYKAVSRHKGYSKDFLARRTGPFSGMKITVITDAGTSSKAEIFAASLRQIAGASIAGEATAGNAAVTKIFRLSDGRGLMLTVAKLVPPSGLELDGRGLLPDRPAPAFGRKGGMGFDLPAACLNSDPAFMEAVAGAKGPSVRSGGATDF